MSAYNDSNMGLPRGPATAGRSHTCNKMLRELAGFQDRYMVYEKGKPDDVENTSSSASIDVAASFDSCMMHKDVNSSINTAWTVCEAFHMASFIHCKASS